MGINYAPEPSGNAPYTTSLSQGLAAKGHSVKVLTGFPHYPEWRVHPDYRGWSLSEAIETVRIKRLRHHVPTKPNGLSRLHMELSFGVRLLFSRWDKPDVIILVSPALFSTAVALFRARLSPSRPKVVIWVQDLYSRGVVEANGGNGHIGKVATWFEGRVLRSAHGVVAIHERFARYIVEALGGSRDAVRVVRNWTHLPEVPPQDRATARRRMGWNEGDIIALHAGNLGKKQGLQNVVNAAKWAEAAGSSVKFVLMGDGNQKRILQDAARGLSNIEFIDSLPQDDFQAAMQAADVLLVNELPGVRDMSVPSKLTSYFSTGVPVIAATDAGSVTAEELELSHAGLRVDADAPQALVEAVERLVADASLSTRLGCNGQKFRQDTLSVEVAIDHYDEFITSLALSRGR
jgi:colanic acid biosynthesis glycosyl transferase WcaI